MAIKLLISIALCIAAPLHGYRKRSLSKSGAIAAGTVGFSSCYFGGYRMAASLLLFYFSSSQLTKYKQSHKKKIDAEFKEGGQRNYVQVFANSGIATIIALLYYFYCGEVDVLLDFKRFYVNSFLLACVLGHYGCCNGDTWASELGVLSSSSPVLITSGKKVPPGTNGGVSLMGTISSFLGGAFIGIVFFLCGILFAEGDNNSPSQIPVIFLGAFAGTIGSLIDSIMGATLQFSGIDETTNKIVNHPGPNIKHLAGVDILDNHQVNFVSVLITTLATGWIAQYFL